MKNKIDIAATLLREVAKKTTDATAFGVEVRKDKDQREILLTADAKRRVAGGGSADTFFHARNVVQVCTALDLSFYITARVEMRGQFPVATFEVRIYEYTL